MIDVVCDAGSRYAKVVAARSGSGAAVALVAPAQEAVDLGALARRAVAALSPSLLEPVRVWHLGEEESAARSALSDAMARLRLAAPRPLKAGPALARAATLLGPEVLLADCGALRTRVFEIARGSATARTLENERCTAGAGRFVETMGAALGIALGQIDECVARAKEPCRVSSPCPVFAESEVVSQINAGRAPEDVLAGVVAHAAEKVATLVERAKPAGRPLVLVGGLARLAAFRAGLAARLPGVRMIEAPADPLLLACLAGLAQVAATPAGSWPAIEALPWGAGDAARS